MTDSIIGKTDLPTEIQSRPTVDLMVAGANGQAKRIAPCLFEDGDTAPNPSQLAEAKLLLLGAIVRWTQQGAGGVQQQTAGPFMVGTIASQSTGYRLWPTEIVQLQDICSGSPEAGPGSIDTAPGLDPGHLPWCDVMFGAVGTASCSCGYDIAGRPIYENKPGL